MADIKGELDVAASRSLAIQSIQLLSQLMAEGAIAPASLDASDDLTIIMKVCFGGGEEMGVEGRKNKEIFSAFIFLALFLFREATHSPFIFDLGDDE